MYKLVDIVITYFFLNIDFQKLFKKTYVKTYLDFK